MENNTENTVPAPVVPAQAEAPEQAFKPNGNSMVKWLLLVVLGLFLISGGVGLGMYMSNNQKKEEAQITPTEAMKQLSPTITQAMPSAAPTETEEATPTESEQEQAQAAIKATFAEKFSKQVNEVNITISDYQPGFAKGGVSFAGEMGGGWFLAAEVGGTWVIADDGNGTITCEKIEPYNFPVSMVSECWSEDTQEIIYR